MRIIISPAKIMTSREDFFEARELPRHLDKTKILLDYLRGLTFQELKDLWKVSDRLVLLNQARLQEMELEDKLLPALMSYGGFQYQALAANIMTYDELDYLQEHLRIISAFYGLLRPFDGIRSYRLEMKSRIHLPSQEKIFKSPYDFWGRQFYDDLVAEEDLENSPVIINLASHDYMKAVTTYAWRSKKMIRCIFGHFVTDKKSGQKRVLMQANEAKTARGDMVRFMATHKIQNPEELKAFSDRGFRFHEDLSDEKHFVFVKES